jgi:hypothetical protein
MVRMRASGALYREIADAFACSTMHVARILANGGMGKGARDGTN